MDVTRERCQKIVEAGANVILCSKGIDDFALKYFVESNAIEESLHHQVPKSLFHWQILKAMKNTIQYS
jgi:hypothetical protein